MWSKKTLQLRVSSSAHFFISTVKGAHALFIDELADAIQHSSPRYTNQPIVKHDGGTRDICIPDALTKRIQRLILRDIDSSITFLPCVMAFRPGTSILDNARAHQGSNYLIHYDLADFFDNINEARIKDELKRQHFTDSFIETIIKWCVYRDHLPQGAPTSPILSNLVCCSLDRRITKLTNKLGAVYTRYADDILISGNANILHCQNVFKRIIRTENFIINNRKTDITALDTPEVKRDGCNINRPRQYHIITGLTVNGEKISIRPEYLRQTWKAVKSDPTSPTTKGKIAFIKQIDKAEGERLRNESNGNNLGKE